MTAIDPADFRRILGHYPTGVCAITAVQPDGVPAAMIVGSFTSVSLDPPLVAFFPDRGSSSWPKIEAAGRFCVNVLSDAQEGLCRILASKDPNKFDDVPHHMSGLGSPVLDGALAWIDCTMRQATIISCWVRSMRWISIMMVRRCCSTRAPMGG
jgi:flavin reductase (DIM6/NTAB) family NADH-FMN oxidoreductase RutF